MWFFSTGSYAWDVDLCGFFGPGLRPGWWIGGVFSDRVLAPGVGCGGSFLALALISMPDRTSLVRIAKAALGLNNKIVNTRTHTAFPS